MQKENIQRVNDLIDDTIDLDEYEKELTTGIDKFEIYDSAGFSAFASYNAA